MDLLQRARALRPLIESEADQIEADATMSAPVVEALAEADLFRLIVPTALGGHEAGIDEIVDVCEELAFADGSVGWAYAQNTTVSSYSAYLAPEFAEPLASARAAAGMFAPLGIAQVREGGFQVSGNYKFGSGCGHAEFMGGAALVMDGEEMVMRSETMPRLLAYIVPIDRVELKGNWDVMGLRGTGSYDFEVPEQFIEDGRCFDIMNETVITGGPIYHIGATVLGTISSTAWAIGVAARALHEITQLATSGRVRLGSIPLAEQTTFQRDLGVHCSAVESVRLLTKHAYGEAVKAIANGEHAADIAQKIRATKSSASYTTKVAKAATTFAWESSGSAGMRNPSRLQRCFRDIYVGAGHQVFDERNYNELVKQSLGQEASPY